nr:hypothetical protein [Tanacetum cinerariifolium]
MYLEGNSLNVDANNNNNMRDKSTRVQNDIHGTKEGTHATDAVGTGMKQSFASIFKTQSVSKAGRLTTMTSEFVQGANVAIPLPWLKLMLIMHGLSLVWNTLCSRMGSFFFQIATREGMERVLENGPWLIRLVPIFLNIWTPNTVLIKDTITSAPIWVKLHHVPIVAFSMIGLSLMTSQHGRPIMLTRKQVVDSNPVEDEDGVTQVKRKNGKGKQDGKAKQVAGIHLTKPKPKMVYREVQKPPTNNNDKATTSNYDSSLRKDNQPTMQPEDGINIFSLRNSFESDSLEAVLDDDDEVEEVYIEDNVRHAKQNKGASTLSDQRLCSKVFKQGKWTSNGLMCFKGSRIILGWNPNVVNVVVVSFDAQVMHVCVYFKADKKELFCSFVYTHNPYLQRRDLWNNLATHKNYIRNRPRSILGVFNVSLSANEKSTGPPNIDTGMRNFQDCVEAIEVSDVNSMSLQFTWNQKPKGEHGTLKKIDSIMANLDFYSSFVGSISGFWMFKVVKHLKMLKKPIRKLLYDHENLHENVKKPRHELDLIWILVTSSFRKKRVISNRMKGSLVDLGKRGLRQGDLMSPYLFTLLMEVLTLMLHRMARVSGSFTYHQYSSKLNLINICFVDDVFLFAHGDVDSARVIMDTLEEFKEALGLTSSLPKSTAYFCNVLNYIKLDILNILPFEEGKLSVKYLGVPLVPSRLLYRYCKELMEKSYVRVRATYGGFSLESRALITSHIWSLLTHKESLCVKWIHSYKPNGHSFWEIAIRASSWFDNWCLLDPLVDIILNRDIYGAGYNLSAKVKDIIVNDSWSWSDVWMSKYYDLGTIGVPHLSDVNDKLVWKDLSNVDVLDHLKRLTAIPNISYGLDAIVYFLSPVAKMRYVRSVISKLVFAASCYFIWQERNSVLFMKNKRSPGYRCHQVYRSS